MRRERTDDGAVAVEFALLFPLFVMLTFGSLSAGMIFWNSISAAQAVRDAARYGATLPLTTTSPPAANTYLIDAWLDAVAQVALREAGMNDANGDGTIDSAETAARGAQVCVAFVQGTASTHPLATKSLTLGAGTAPATTDPCIAADGAPPAPDRVQVRFNRDESFSAIFLSREFTNQSKSVQPYQRVVK